MPNKKIKPHILEPEPEIIAKYSLCGFIATLTEIIVGILLVKFMNAHYLFAGTVAFVVAVSTSYSLNSRWTFKNRKKSKEQYFVFWLINLGALIMTLGIIAIGVRHFEVPFLIVQPFAAITVGIWSYVMNAYITFRKR